MRQRAFLPLHRSVGEIAVALDGSLAPASHATIAADLRRARSLGVDVVDATWASDHDTARLALAEAFPSPVDRPTILFPVDHPVGSVPRDAAVPDAGPPPPGRADPPDHLLPGARHVAMIVDPGPELSRTSEGVVRLERARIDGKVGAWGVGWRDSASARAGVRAAVEAGARVLDLPFNLLDQSALTEHLGWLQGRGACVVVHDPFADGRLDGSLLRDGPLRFHGPPRVAAIDELHRRFDGVTQLGFLTAAHGRTLAQAGLQVALRWPVVATVAVPLAAPDLLASYTHLEQVPELTEEEWARWAGTVGGSTNTAAGVP